MLPVWMALAGAAKSELIDRPAHEKQVQSRGIEARFAPLLGQAAPSFSDLKAPDTFQSAMDYGITGAMMQKEGMFGGDKTKGEGKKILDAVSPAQKRGMEAGLGPVSKATANSDATFEALAPKQQPAVFGSDYRGADPRFEDTMAAFNKAPIIAKDNNLSNEEFAKFLQGNTGGFSGRRF